MSSSEVPCPACKWTPDQQRRCAYQSSVRLFHRAHDRGYWCLGSKLLLKERGKEPPSHEVINIHFIKENTTIPVPNRAGVDRGREIFPDRRAGAWGYRWRRSDRQSPNPTGKDWLVRPQSIWGSFARSTPLRWKVSMANRFGVLVSLTMMILASHMAH